MLKIKLIITYVCIVLSLALFEFAPQICTANVNEMKYSEKIEERINNVINGLLPETDIKERFGDKVTLADRMKYYHSPGVSIAVINDYKIEWARGFGVKENGKSQPVTKETIFQAGSISKPVFAVAVMRLVEEGKLNLDEDINNYLTSWQIPSNESWQPRVTLRQLLSHSAGLTVHGFPGYQITEQIPSVVQILNGEEPSNTKPILVNTFPGTQFRYSGGGTTVGQQLLVDLLEKPFPELMRDYLLNPLRMKNSTFEQPMPKRLRKFAATGHPYADQPLKGKWHIYPEMAAAGLWTNPSELARFGIAMQLSIKGDSDQMLSSENAKKMLTAHIKDYIGLGFFLEGEGENIRFGHGGADAGFIADISFYKHHGFGAVVMINANRAWPMIDEIFRSIAKEYAWPEYFPEIKSPIPINSEDLDNYVGEFHSEKPKCRMVISKENGILYFQLNDQHPIELNAEEEDKFYMNEVNAKITFNKSDEGEISSIKLEQDRGAIEATKTQ